MYVNVNVALMLCLCCHK